ncbi:sialidase family protein [Thiomicrorhabdus sp. 6S3-12]|uniref:sialidase family protein n=1 Tax=Thiomicrorhabdus sp. 6S3-12 TaxID=2819681 RepID=UPI001FB6521C|nr:sialidase family protein [Thiomicrorhabdus sp. 6S3-12]
MQKMIEYPQIKLNFSKAPKTDAPVFLAEGIRPLSIEHNGPFIRNCDGDLLCIHGKTAYLSANDGKDWQAFELFSEQMPFKATDAHSLLCTRDGTVILSFLNAEEYHFNWVKKRNAPTKNSRLYHYVVRSEDGGRSWQEPIRIQTGYAAVSSTMIQLESGAIVLSAQNLDYQQARHYSLSFRSDDDGLSWHASNKLDIGGRGHHGGCYEGTLVELPDRVWYCIRTNQDYFWHAYSYDDGRSWTQIHPGIEASSSPAMLKRLASGRLLMVYNTLYPQGETEFPRRGGQFSEVAASWHREELAVCYSEDDGESWSDPLIVAQCKGAWLAYPYLFEVSPGKIWLTTMQSELRLEFYEDWLLQQTGS